MKFAVVALAVLAVLSPLDALKVPASGSGALAKELQELVDLVPVADVLQIVKLYIAQDKEIQHINKAVTSAESKALVKEVEEIPDAIALMQYIQKAGVDIYRIVNALNKSLGLSPIKPSSTLSKITGGGMNGLTTDLWAVVPFPKIQAAIEKKMIESKVFRDFVAELSRQGKLHLAIATNKHLLNLKAEAIKAGIKGQDFVMGYEILLGSHVLISNNISS